MTRLLQKPTLLLVTEQLAILAWIRKELSEQFYLLDADSELPALDLLDQALIDFVILDGRMPHVLDLCSKIRHKLIKRKTPIILITGRLKRQFRDAAFLQGVTSFVSDEYDSSELQNQIDACFKTVEAEEKVSDLSLLIPIPTAQIAEGYFENRFILQRSDLQFFKNAKAEKLFFVMVQIDPLKKLDSATLNQISGKITGELTKTIGLKNLVLKPSKSDHFSDHFIVLAQKIETPTEFIDSLKDQMNQLVESSSLVNFSFAYGNVQKDEGSFHTMVEVATKALSHASKTPGLILSLDEGNFHSQ